MDVLLRFSLVYLEGRGLQKKWELPSLSHFWLRLLNEGVQFQLFLFLSKESDQGQGRTIFSRGLAFCCRIDFFPLILVI